MIDFVGRRKWFFLVSGIIILVGILFLIPAGPFGLEWGIEFTSGSMMTIEFEQDVSASELQQEMASLGHGEAIVQGTEDNTFIVRANKFEESVQDPATGKTVSEEEMIRIALEERFGELEILSSYDISPSISQKIASNAAIAVVVAAIGILLYVTWAFRKLIRSVRFGVCAIIALIHDVLVVVGLYAFLGTFFLLEVDVMFIAGILTVIGYSVNDTIVVFDRIRENRLKNPNAPLSTTVNQSIMETIGRSINTSLTTLLVVLALFLLGGESIHNFVLILLVGVITGTYSSIAIASQFLIVWENGTFGRVFRRVIPRRVLARG